MTTRLDTLIEELKPQVGHAGLKYVGRRSGRLGRRIQLELTPKAADAILPALRKHLGADGATNGNGNGHARRKGHATSTR